MEAVAVIGIISAVVLVYLVLRYMTTEEVYVVADEQTDEQTDEQRKMRQDAKIVCQQCRKRGSVQTRQVMQKKGISGGKATAGCITGGLSLLVTGLSRKEQQTEATCSNCGSVCHF